MFSTLSTRTFTDSIHFSLYTASYLSCLVALVSYVKRSLYPRLLVFCYCLCVDIPLTLLTTKWLALLSLFLVPTRIALFISQFKRLWIVHRLGSL